MHIDFKNGNCIKVNENNDSPRRGIRSNFTETLCLDTECKDAPVYVWKRIDLQEKLDRYIPVAYLANHEFLSKFSEYKRYYTRHPTEFIEMVMGVKLSLWQKMWVMKLFRYKN